MSSLKRLTLLQKREIGNKPGFNSKSRQKIAQDYGISQATISVILSKKSEILEKTDNVKQDWFSALNCMESSLVNSISQSKKSQPKITAFFNANNNL